jgi:hypothetical protein
MPPRVVAVDIVGADVMGKTNDKEVSGDAEEVTQRRSQVQRRRTVAIQALLDDIKPVGKLAPVSAAYGCCASSRLCSGAKERRYTG